MEDKDISRIIYEQAKSQGACDLIKGGESVAELARLMFTPQGREFCIRHGFPDHDTLRAFLPYKPERYGVHIDAGDITLYDTDCFLIGDTRATVRLSDVRNFRVLLMHGASATVEAGGHSVVRVIADKKSQYTTQKRDNAIILE